MSDEPTVNAGDIARLGNVGRAAVSNWRRRHEDFPRPVGGTASSPLFSLPEVQDWLYRNGKSFEISVPERAWQALRAGGDDVHLGDRLADIGVRLLAGEPTEPGIAELVAERGPGPAFEFLCGRFAKAHSRNLLATPPEVAALMIRLAGTEGATVLDPACGLGTLLLAAPAARVLGQDSDPTLASIARTRLALRGTPATIVAGDTLRHNGFSELADAVVCDPPFGERNWGYDELTGDPRWEYGLPPRGESELAWVQHCLARVRPGGLVAILMPGAAASRRPGKRIRGNLLRAGALRAVVTLPGGSGDLWLLRRPLPGERPPARIALLETGTDLSTVDLESGGVSVLDLLDEDVDLSPGRHRAPHGALGRDYLAALDELRSRPAAIPPALDILDQREPLPLTSLAELVKSGILTVQQAQSRVISGTGELPVLTIDDLATGTEPTGRTDSEPGLVMIEPGDVVTSAIGPARVVRVNAVLGPYLTRYRPDPRRLDPEFLAGILRSADPRSASRTDVRRTRIPRLAIADQRAYGEAFRRLLDLHDTVRSTAELGERLVRLGLDGLIDGHLRPGRQ